MKTEERSCGSGCLQLESRAVGFCGNLALGTAGREGSEVSPQQEGALAVVKDGGGKQGDARGGDDHGERGFMVAAEQPRLEHLRACTSELCTSAKNISSVLIVIHCAKACIY